MDSFPTPIPEAFDPPKSDRRETRAPEKRFRLTFKTAVRIVLGAALLLMPWATLSPSTAPPSSAAAPMHVIALAVLTLLALVSFVKIWQRALAVVSVFSYSALMELLQYFHPERNGTLEDLAANALGCVVGVCACITAAGVHKIVKKINSNPT